MKILHVIPSYIPAYNYGGPVKAVHGLCKALAREGIDVTVFTTDIDSKGKLKVALNKMIDIEGVKVFYHPVTLMRSYCFSRDLSSAIKKHIHEFDLVHIHSIYLYPTFCASYWSRKRRIPYIINPFGALDPEMIRLKDYAKKMLYINLIERRNINRARAIHAASFYESEKIRSLGFEVPVTIVPRGIDLEDYVGNNEPEFLLERYPELKGKEIILFLGRIHRKKGFDLLARAFKKIANYRKDTYLAIAGPDENGYLNKVKKIFNREGMLEKTIFTGLLLGEEKIAAFYASDIFILPSYGENFGIAALEAMTCKLPVVITNRVGLYPDVEEYSAGIVTDCDSNKFADAILKLLDNKNLRKSMGENGRRLVKERFTLHKVAGRMIDVYKKIVER